MSKEEKPKPKSKQEIYDEDLREARTRPDEEIDDAIKLLKTVRDERDAAAQELYLSEIVADCPSCAYTFSRAQFTNPRFLYCPVCSHRGAVKREVSKSA